MPSIIIGGGRVGQALRDMGVEGDVVVRRGEAFPSEPKTGPIYVATRNDVLEDVIKNCPADRREDLVFMQNGMLQQFLDAQGLGANTQALIYFAVAALGDKPTDGVTELNPEGLTAATGKWADAVAARKDAIKGRVSIELRFRARCKPGSREGVPFSPVSSAFRGGVFTPESVRPSDGAYDLKSGSVV